MMCSGTSAFLCMHLHQCVLNMQCVVACVCESVQCFCVCSRINEEDSHDLSQGYECDSHLIS